MMDVHRAVNDANLPNSADLPGYYISGESDPGHPCHNAHDVLIWLESGTDRRRGQ
jgi:hypothetical protein